MSRLKFYALGAGLLLGACSSTSTTRNAAISAEQQQAQAEAKLCTNMSDTRVSVINYPQVTPETPLDSIQAANSKVDEAVQKVNSSASELANPRILEVQAAYRELLNATHMIPGGRATVGDASDSLQASAESFRNAWDQLYMSMQCGA